jgi:hypothetical protein
MTLLQTRVNSSSAWRRKRIGWRIEQEKLESKKPKTEMVHDKRSKHPVNTKWHVQSIILTTASFSHKQDLQS